MGRGEARYSRDMGPSRAATVLVAALGVAIAVAVGYGLHQSAKKRAEQRALVTVVTETTRQLQAGLKAPSSEMLEQLDGQLAVARAWSNPYAADATEHYLIGAREILRLRAESLRLARHAAASRAALQAHMGAAARRDSQWIRAASALKKQVERDHADLDRVLATLAEQLEALPDSQKRLAPYVDASLILQDQVRKQAREQALAEARQSAAALKEARSLAPRF